jgi:hypothetical protein
MKERNRIFLFAVFWAVCVVSPSVHVYGQNGSDFKPSLFSPAGLLIQQKAVRAELAVNKEQIPMLNHFCETLDPLLFACRPKIYSYLGLCLQDSI